MTKTRKIFSQYDEEDLALLNLCYKAIESSGSTQDQAYAEARKNLANLPEGAIINLLCSPNPDSRMKEPIERIKQFCREDKELKIVWENKLVKKSYINKETRKVDGKTVSAFDHYVGFICNAAFMDARFDRQDRAKVVLIAADYNNYHALLIKCESILTILRKNPEALSQQKERFNATLYALSNVFWSLGYLQSGCMLHQLKKIYKDDDAVDDRMMRSFIKAEAFVDVGESKYIYSAVRHSQPLSDFLMQVFGVNSIEKVKQKLEGNFTADVFAINHDGAYAEVINDLIQALDTVDSERDESSEAEEKKFADLSNEIANNKLKSAEIEGLLKKSLLNQNQPTVVQSSVKQNPFNLSK